MEEKFKQVMHDYEVKEAAKNLKKAHLKQLKRVKLLHDHGLVEKAYIDSIEGYEELTKVGATLVVDDTGFVGFLNKKTKEIVFINKKMFQNKYMILKPLEVSNDDYELLRSYYKANHRSREKGTGVEISLHIISVLFVVISIVAIFTSKGSLEFVLTFFGALVVAALLQSFRMIVRYLRLLCENK